MSKTFKLRLTKGSELTHVELDNNQSILLESASLTYSSASISGNTLKLFSVSSTGSIAPITHSYEIVSSSYAVTASYAISSSVEVTKEVSSSNADTASYFAEGIVTASAANNIITFTKDDSSNFNVTIDTGSLKAGLLSSSAQIAEDISGSLSNVAISALNAGIVSASAQIRDRLVSAGAFSSASNASIRNTLGTNQFILSGSKPDANTLRLHPAAGTNLDYEVGGASDDRVDGLLLESGSVKSRLNTIEAATSSYATKAGMDLVSGSGIINAALSGSTTNTIRFTQQDDTTIDITIATSSVSIDGLVSSSAQIDGAQLGANKNITIAGTSVNLGSSISLSTINAGSSVVSSSVLSNPNYGQGLIRHQVNGGDPADIQASNLSKNDSPVFDGITISGSTNFGSGSNSNNHLFTGSVYISGGLHLGGGGAIGNDITGAFWQGYQISSSKIDFAGGVGTSLNDVLNKKFEKATFDNVDVELTLTNATGSTTLSTIDNRTTGLLAASSSYYNSSSIAGDTIKLYTGTATHSIVIDDANQRDYISNVQVTNGHDITFTGVGSAFDGGISITSVDSASHAEFADLAHVANSATTATSASHSEFADLAHLANSAPSASHAEFADTATSASHAEFADLAHLANSATTATSATSASHALKADSANANYYSSSISGDTLTLFTYTSSHTIAIDDNNDNNFLTGLSLNPSSGVLTATRSGLGNVIVDLPIGTDDDLTVKTITATSASFEYLHSDIVSSSILLTTGSNIFGDQDSDTHTFTGSVFISGTLHLGGGHVRGNEITGAYWEGYVISASKVDIDVSGFVDTSGTPVDNDFAKFTDSNTIEGRTYAEVRSDLGLEIGTDVLAQQTIGIANNNLLEVDDADAEDNDYAKFTANGLEGRSYAEVRSDINVEDGANNYSHPNHSGDVTSSGDGATTIANDAVTYAKMQNIPTANILGRVTAGSGNVEDLTATQVRTLLNVADGATNVTNNNQITNGAGYTTATGTVDTSGTPAAQQIAIFTDANTVSGSTNLQMHVNPSYPDFGGLQVGSGGTANLYLGNPISPSSADKGARFHSDNNDFYFDFQGDATQHFYFRDYDGGGGIFNRFTFDFINSDFETNTGTFSGNVTANNFVTTSDRKLKKDIEPIKEGLETLKKFVSYEYELDGKKDAGFIAQEVQESLPYAVHTKKDGYLALDTKPIIAHIHKAILEIDQRLSAIEEKLK